LTSALYEDPIILFREYAQNSLDAYIDATRDKSKEFEDFSVEIKIDNKNTNIEIRDNGYGIQEKNFLTEMKRIGESNKKVDQIGFRGIGRLSAMPLCKELIFENKPQGINKRLIFKWDGETFNKLLNKGQDINASLDDLTSFNPNEKYDGNIDDHYFKVEIRGYKEAIDELLKSKEFIARLSVLLPLRYSPDFKKQEEIKKKYQEFMGQSLNKYTCNVRLDKKELYKPYNDTHILKSGIRFWELIYPGKGEKVPDEKIGILWFTFNQVIKALPKDAPYGISVRSKNMLMGDRYSLASDASRSKTDYITTFRELAQTLNGVCGEMLIDHKLNDNARRDWFKIDEESIKLRQIIVEFMRRLHTYRYAASNYFTGKEKKEEKLIEAFKGLITNYEPDKFISDVNKLKKEIEASKKVFEFADEDIPTLSPSLKRFYERLMTGLYKYFSEKGEIEEFIKARKYLKEYLNTEPKS
ncbi:ATP-binding protein, partial [Chloroflexota bacterium]